jgi:hypothetical protein
MIAWLWLLLGSVSRLLSSRRDLLLENLALRQQLAVLKARHPRPTLAAPEKLFWVVARRFWSGWKQSLILVAPETVVRWQATLRALSWSSSAWASANLGAMSSPTSAGITSLRVTKSSYGQMGIMVPVPEGPPWMVVVQFEFPRG